MADLKINCLVQINGNNQADFNEWIEYHLALGFDYIYLFDTGIHPWIDSVAAKYKNVVMVPREDDWRKKSKIINTYVSRRRAPEWTICLDDHDFLWIDPRVARNVHQLLSKFPQDIGAITFYVKYMSSEHGMKNRVGTQIDCFTHSSPNSSTNSLTPNSGVTMFMVTNPNTMPLRNPIVPTTMRWMDSMLRPLNEPRVMSYLGSPTYNPASFPARIYRYALRSGVEMEFKPGTKPTGYTVSDPTMQNARSMLIGVPVNMDTERLFAKDVIPEEETEQEPHEMSADEIAEHNLPISVGRIDQMILHGNFLTDVEKYLQTDGKEYDGAVLARVYDRERLMIIESSDAYKTLYKLSVIDNKTDAEICAEMKITNTVYRQMCECLKVLNMADYLEAGPSSPIEQSDEEFDGGKLEPTVIIKTEDKKEETIEALTEAFDKDVEANDLTAEEKYERDQVIAEKEEAVKAKRKANSKKKKKALAASDEEKAEIASLVNECKETAPELQSTEEVKPVESDEIGLEMDNLLNDTDISSLIEK